MLRVDRRSLYQATAIRAGGRRRARGMPAARMNPGPWFENRPCRQRCNRRSSRTPSALADPPSSDTLKIKSPQPGQLIFCRTATAPALFSGAAPARPVPIVPPLVVALSADHRSIVSASIRCQPPWCGELLRQCVTTQTCDLGKHLGACACAVGSRRLRAHEQRGSTLPMAARRPRSGVCLDRRCQMTCTCAPCARLCHGDAGIRPAFTTASPG